MNEQTLKNKIDAINELNTVINKLVPLYLDYFRKGFKVNKDLSLSKKDKEAIKKIDASISIPDKIQHYFSFSEYSGRVVFRTNWAVVKEGKEYHSTDYHEDSFYLLRNKAGWNEVPNWVIDENIEYPEPLRSVYTLEAVQVKQAEVKALEEQKKALEDKISNTKDGFRIFFER